jgi:UDP-N-acetylglucosamine--N-acetylmuramyl-(pentapeptide) pyrophosphoryl-undecaprenol N-acetylglucosamine transferase
MKKIMFTGGGSAGHVTVNISLIPRFHEEGWSIEYIGSENGIEKQLVSSLSGVRYHEVATGKLRRYYDWQNIKDPLKIVKGALQAFILIKKQKPNVLFSKGGFVSVPVVLGAWLNKVPVIIHESDVTPGLANRLSIPLSTTVCTTFPDTEKYLPKGKSYYVGPIIREDLIQGSAELGRKFCQLTDKKPVLLIMGGSLGSRKINQTIRAGIDQIVKKFQVIHLCGKGQIDSSIHCSEYKQYEYLNKELADVLAMTDIVISRAGANSIFELLSLHKPMLLIPLTKEQSRGDQILNAASFKESGFCEVLFEEQLRVETMIRDITQMYENRQVYIKSMERFKRNDALSLVFDLIKQTAK